MPNFLVIGAAKAGTTSLYHYLKEHPSIFLPEIKEPNFFAVKGNGQVDRLFTLGAEYENTNIWTLADYQALFKGVSPEIQCGECSPLYLESRVACQNIKKLVPDIKLICILRNPADRTYSNYCMHQAQGLCELDESKAFYENAPYVQNGFYYRMLKPYFDVFERRQIQIVFYEQLKNEPAKLYRELCRFIGVDEDFNPNLNQRYNPGGVPRNYFLARCAQNQVIQSFLYRCVPSSIIAAMKRVYRSNLKPFPPLSSAARGKLINIYREDITNLGDLLQVSLSHWLDGSLPNMKDKKWEH